MGIRSIKVISMTDLNNSNADEEHPNAESHGGGNVPSSDANDLDAAWTEFASSHADDLKAVEHSRNAKRFEKHAQRREKEALLSICRIWIRVHSPTICRKVVDHAISRVPAGWTPIA